MPNRKDVSDHLSEEDRRLIESDPEADLARGKARPETDPREKIQHEGDKLIEDFDPDEIDPRSKPRSPI